MPRRVLVCDDSPEFSLLLEHWLEDHATYAFVGDCATAADTLRRARELRPDIVVLDTLGDPHDATLLRALRIELPAARLVVCSGYEPHQLGPEVVAAADACVVKDSDERSLIAALDRLA